MPAPVQPIVDQLPIPNVQVPDLPQMPQLPAPSAEAHARAHLGIAEDLTLDADLHARTGSNGVGASAASRLQYGTDENGAAIYGSASTQNGVVGGAQLALTDEELRVRMAATTANGGSAQGSIAGGDEHTGAQVAAGVDDIAGVPRVNVDGTIRTGPLVVTGTGHDLTGTPQGTLAGRMNTEVAPGVVVGGSGELVAGPDGVSGGGSGHLQVQTGPATIDVHGGAQSNGSGQVGVNIMGEF